MAPDDESQLGDRAGQLRRGATWLLLTAALGSLGTGIALGHGLLMAGGLVLAGIYGHLLATDARGPAHPRRG
ncbi:hypothetical protein ACIRPT_04555 [Streptomyces sp. NPDC101227]|uniref:hypothetical protein n=1 Tax=Streptomyces sp. NPDC101227 TaxID=3366136 RepID=UPI00380AE01B